MNLLQRAVIDPYRTIMDPTVNSLKYLPPSQRFQVTIYLSMMWTLIFCVGTGAWLWFGQLVVLHVLVAVGALITGLTFRIARADQSYAR